MFKAETITLYEIFALLIAFGALLLSLRSSQISNASKKIANEALETSKYQFLQLNRPWINLSPKKFENEMFWEVTQKGNQVEILLNYEIKNVGNVAAKNISLPNRLEIGPNLKLEDDAPVTFEKPSQITLGPGDELVIKTEVIIPYKDEETAIRNLEHFISGNSKGITSQISVTYENALDELLKYRTIIESIIHNKVARIIKSEMVDLTSTEVK